MVLHAAFPLLVSACDRFDDGAEGTWRPLEDVRFSRAVALLLMAGASFAYRLVRDYSKTLILVYGGGQFWLGAAILQHGTVSELLWRHPRLLPHIVERDAYFVVSCVQFGFLWYYLYSRRLVSKATVRGACTRYHPVLFYAWCLRLNVGAWWDAAPWTMWPVSFLGSMLATLFLYKMVRAGTNAGSEEEEATEDEVGSVAESVTRLSVVGGGAEIEAPATETTTGDLHSMAAGW